MKVSEIKLIGDKLLIRPLKLKTKLQVQSVPEAVNPDKVLKPGEVREMKVVEKEVPVRCEIQKAMVLTVGDWVSADEVQAVKNGTRIHVGDTVLYHIKTGVPFDYINNTLLLKTYDVIGVINKVVE